MTHTDDLCVEKDQIQTFREAETRTECTEKGKRHKEVNKVSLSNAYLIHTSKNGEQR